MYIQNISCVDARQNPDSIGIYNIKTQKSQIMHKTRNNFKILNSGFLICIILTITAFQANAQYSKNPLLDITDEGYTMVVKKFVKIPDDDGARPRINCITHMHDRIFASTELGGKIYEIIDNGDGTYSTQLFFDVKAAIPLNTGGRQLWASTSSYHSGLRSVAFHPDFMSNGKFYTSLMEERPSDTTGHHYLSDISDPSSADGTLIEWTYNFDSNKVDEHSYRELFRVATPQLDHPMKQISFDPLAEPDDEDYGLLYIGHGDGNIYNHPVHGGQRNDGRGKILRIDPLQTDSTRYSIPPTNPFVGDTNWLDEIYATGMRNPHSLCFAKDDTGGIHLISANAGRVNIEEVNMVTPGDNYGWNNREGTYVQLPGGGLTSGIEALPATEADSGYTFPAAQWSHSQPLFSGYSGKSIVGGFVYTIKSNNQKIYLSADFPQSGIVMYNDLDELLNAVTKLDPGDPDRDMPEDLTQAPFHTLAVYYDDDNDTNTAPIKKTWMRDVIDDDVDYDGSGRSDLRFGQDMNGNIYISNKRNGWIYEIESINPPVTPEPPNPTSLAANRISSGNAVTVYPNPSGANGILHAYFVNRLKEDAEIKLISSDGRIISAGLAPAGEHQHLIDLGELQITPGFYILKVQSTSFAFQQPVVIK